MVPSHICWSDSRKYAQHLLVVGFCLSSVSQSVVKQTGAAPIFTRCGRATLTPVLEYLVTEPPLKRWDATLCRTSSQGHAEHGPQVVLHSSNAYSPAGRVRKPKNVTQFNAVTDNQGKKPQEQANYVYAEKLTTHTPFPTLSLCLSSS